MIYGIIKIKTLSYGNAETGMSILTEDFSRRQILSYVFEVGKKDIQREERSGAKAQRLMSMWSSQETTKRPKQLLFRVCGWGVEREGDLESDDRNMGKDNGEKH